MEDRLTKIIESLVKGTTSSKLNWQDTERDNEFVLKLEKGAITVDSWDNWSEEDNDVQSLVDIGFLNNLGESVERFTYSSSDYSDYKKIMELHKLAKRNHLKIDETLDEILLEIERKIN
jgi:hypothetical protein